MSGIKGAKYSPASIARAIGGFFSRIFRRSGKKDTSKGDESQDLVIRIDDDESYDGQSNKTPQSEGNSSTKIDVTHDEIQDFIPDVIPVEEDDDDILTELPSPTPQERKHLSRKYVPTDKPSDTIMFSSAGSEVQYSALDASTRNLLKPSASTRDIRSPTKTILEGAAAVTQSGIPPGVAAVLASVAIDFGIGFTVRSNDMATGSYGRYFEDEFTAKNTNIHTKSHKIYSPLRGHIPKSPHLYDPKKTKDLTDHQEAGSFPPGMTTHGVKPLANEVAEQILDSSLNEKILTTGMWNGRYCLEVERDAYIFAKLDMADSLIEQGVFEKSNIYNNPHNGIRYIKLGNKVYQATGKKQRDYYIQETESLRSILIGVQNGHYKLNSFDSSTGELKYSTGSPANVYVINIYELRAAKYAKDPVVEKVWQQPETAADANHKLLEFIPENCQELVSAIDFGIVEDTKFLDYIAPVQQLKDGNRVPVMVVGDPCPIANDFDLGNFTLPKDLPEFLLAPYNTFNALNRYQFKTALLKFLDELQRDKDEHTGKYSTQLHKLCELNMPDPNSKDGRRFIDSCLATDKLSRVGTISMAEYLYSCVINQRAGLRIVQHGAESKNPAMGQELPEPFGAMTHFFSGKTVFTNDEPSCIALYLYHEKELASRHIHIHPYWLRERPNAKEPDGNPNLREAWLDIIKYQALCGFEKEIEASFSNLSKQYPQAFSAVMQVLDEVAAIKRRGDVTKQQAKKDVLAKYKSRAYRNPSFTEFSESCILKLNSPPDSGSRFKKTII